jgi:hypothetical protein
MDTDDSIADLFSKVVQDLDPAVDVLVRNGERLGRRMRSRRRAFCTAGNTAAVAAVAVAGTMIGLHQGSPPGLPSVAGAAGAAGARHSATASPSASPSASSGATASPSGGMTRHQMLAELRSLLPAGSAFTDVRTDTVRGALEFDYNDSKGAVDFDLFVSSTSVPHSPLLACPKPPWNGDEGPRPAGALPISCVMRQLAGGTVERDMVTGADVKSFYAYQIIDIRPGGIRVEIQVGNGIIHTLPQVDRATPPGSMTEWESVVENPAWHL